MAIGVGVGVPLIAVLRNALAAAGAVIVHAASYLLESGGHLLTETGDYLLLE